MDTSTGLRRSLGLPSLIALGAAGVVGTSWIYTNGEFFSRYGAGGEILGLVAAAVLACGVAVAYGQLASVMPRAGGEVVYAYTALGRRAAFAGGWFLIGAYVSSLAFYVTALGDLVADVLPAFDALPLYSVAGEPVTLPVLALGLVLVGLVLAANLRGVELAARAQIGLFAVMVALGLVLAVVGFAAGSPDNAWPPFAPGTDPVQQTARFVLPGLTFLTGFGLVAVLAEDARVPPRRLRLAVVLAVVLAAGFYVVVLLASAWVVPWELTATTEKGTIDAFRLGGFPALGWAAYAIALLGLVTSFLALFAASSRILVAMGRAALLPARLGALHGPRRTPRTALAFTLVVTVVLGLLGPGALTWFLDAGGVFVALAWGLGVLSLYRLPRRRPDLAVERGPVVRFLPAAGALAAVLVAAAALWPGTAISLVWPEEYLVLLAWLVLGLVLYRTRDRTVDDRAALAALLGDDSGEQSGEQSGADQRG